MKKILWLVASAFLFSFCMQTELRLSPYPEGIVFPVEKLNEVVYEGAVTGEIFHREDKLFFATRQGDILCLAASGKKTLWKIQLGEPLGGPLSLAEEYLFVTDLKNTLHCLDVHGNRRWQKSVDSKITGPVSKIGEAVFFGTEEGHLVALDGDEGHEIWRYTTGVAVRSNPVGLEEGIAFGCDDSFLYILDRNGSLVSRFKMEDRIGATLSKDGQFLYFGTENGLFICFDFMRSVIRWKVKTGGNLTSPPLVAKKRVYFLTWNSVLYCLHRTNGSIIWWKSILSRIPYRLLIADDKIVVSSLSSTLICLDVLTGSTLGRADVGGEMKSNVLWIAPHLFVSVHDKKKGTEQIVVLKKEVRIALDVTPESPQEVNNEILFSAQTVGFFEPQFEFYLIEGDVRTTVQEKSRNSRWAWFPSQPGSYKIGVSVQDERQQAETEVPFVIEREKPQVSLSSSLPSPQQAKQRIVFSATSKGLTEPQYLFRIYRLFWIPLGAGGYLLIEEKDEVFQKSPESSECIWTPGSEGLFFIQVKASSSDGQAETSRYFLILKDDF